MGWMSTKKWSGTKRQRLFVARSATRVLALAGRRKERPKLKIARRRRRGNDVLWASESRMLLLNSLPATKNVIETWTKMGVRTRLLPERLCVVRASPRSGERRARRFEKLTRVASMTICASGVGQ